MAEDAAADSRCAGMGVNGRCRMTGGINQGGETLCSWHYDSRHLGAHENTFESFTRWLDGMSKGATTENTWNKYTQDELWNWVSGTISTPKFQSHAELSHPEQGDQ